MAAKYSATVLYHRSGGSREYKYRRCIGIQGTRTCGSETRRWVSYGRGSLLLLGITVDGLTLCTRQVHDDPCFTETQAPGSDTERYSRVSRVCSPCVFQDNNRPTVNRSSSIFMLTRRFQKSRHIKRTFLIKYRD